MDSACVSYSSVLQPHGRRVTQTVGVRMTASRLPPASFSLTGFLPAIHGPNCRAIALLLTSLTPSLAPG